MRRSRASSEPDGWRGDEGSAALEFIVAGAVLLIPIVYLIVALASVQAHALGTQAAARHIARAVATAPDAATAQSRSDRVRAAIAEEYGMDAASLDVGLSCAGAGPCPAAGETVIVTVRTDVALPLVPRVLGLDEFARVPVEAQSLQRMSRLWGTS